MSIIWDLSRISALNTNLVHEVHWYKKLYWFFRYYIQVYVMMFFQRKFLPGFSLSVLPATPSSSRPQCLHIRAIHFNPNLSILNPRPASASTSSPRPRATLSVCTCSDPVLPLIYLFPSLLLSHLFCLSLYLRLHSPHPAPPLSLNLPSSPCPYLPRSLCPSLSVSPVFPSPEPSDV